MKINFAYKYRIYPNAGQKILIAKHFGCVRFVWNYFLNERKEFYLKNEEAIKEKKLKGLNYYDNAKFLTMLKKEEETNWLKEVNSQSLQTTLKHLESAYNMFFRKSHQFPCFKNKYSKQSFTIPQHFSLKNGKIYFPKFKEGIKVKEHRNLEGKFVVATISRNHIGQYYVAIIVEKEMTDQNPLSTSIGVDLGVKDLAICSDGKIFENSKYLRTKEKRLKYAQRQLSRKQHPRKKGDKTKRSNNYIKQQLRLAKIHQNIKNSRIDRLHKVSNLLTNENQVVAIEDLNVKGMVKNHNLAKSIQDASWHELVRQLDYKSKWKNRSLIKIDRFFPSSKTCNNCRFVNKDLQLKQRQWVCPNCNMDLNRDINAAKNILWQALLANDNKIADGIAVKSLGSCQH